MLKIYLTRHGQCEGNKKGIQNGRLDTRLTEFGIKQAENAAKNIKRLNMGIEKLYSSPLQRAYKTAEIISDKLGLSEPEIIKDLIERDFGKFGGVDIQKAVEESRPDVLKTKTITYMLHPPGGETFPEVVRRAKKVLKEIKNRHKDGNILLVAHADVGKMLFAAFYNLDWKKALGMFHFGNSDIVLLQKGLDPKKAQIVKTKQFNL